MNFCIDNWNEEKYVEFINYLKSMQEVKYKKFHERLVKTKYHVLGIRVPTQRRIANEISKGNAISFLSLVKYEYYEEVAIAGFVIANLYEEDRIKYFYSFIDKIDNWAICDGFCASIKLKKNEMEEYFKICLDLLKTKETYHIRVGLVMLLDNFVLEEYVLDILKAVDAIINEEYYVNMARAWLVAECFIKYPSIALPYLKNSNLDKFTQNKTISKIRDSYRVSKATKDSLLQYKK